VEFIEVRMTILLLSKQENIALTNSSSDAVAGRKKIGLSSTWHPSKIRLRVITLKPFDEKEMQQDFFLWE